MIGMTSSIAGSIVSSVVPCAELYVCQSSDAASTSLQRDSAQKSSASLR
jgi:hypothetical protein